MTATNFAGTSPSAGLLIGPDGNPLPTANAGIGVVIDGTPFTGGGFDGNGNACSWQALGSSPTLAWNGVTFDLGNPNQPDFTFTNGQTIPVTQGASTTLNLANAAVNGPQANQQITLTFTNTSTVVWTQSFSDWGSPSGYAGETINQQQSSRVNQRGQRDEPDELRLRLRLPDRRGQDPGERRAGARREIRHPRHLVAVIGWSSDARAAASSRG